jgi:hypothetical protein
MWPFTGKRIFGSRWWALAFVVFVCWQAVDMAGSASDATNASGSKDAETIEDALGN